MELPKFKVTKEKFDEIFTIESWLNFGGLDNKEIYEIMLQFVVDEKGDSLDPEQARKTFKKVRKGQWNECVANFAQSVRDAFVSPTNGG